MKHGKKYRAHEGKIDRTKVYVLDNAIQLAKDAGFADCYNIGGNDKLEMMEQFAWFWINLAMFQGHGREIGFKLLKR
jgi:hypothetical protein